ncbi:S-layer homology domain-containing protein [Bacillus litorisediminis]|uniref:S-layer homology domain-containing protein n=1 Tax=Bacillus litorisediminis TaxID=2922713 RepID=UPI001FAC0F19|nr:S-layer homology domain-containing protein [Bacillus litorisediminis]
MKKVFVLLTAIFMFLSFLITPVGAATKFSDIPSNHWAKNEIDYLVGKEIIYGFPNGQFKPNEKLTRIQIAMMIQRAKQYPEVSIDPGLSDIKQGNKYYTLVATLIHEGLFTDVIKTDKFDPGKFVTRAEMASILAKAFDLKGISDKKFTDVPTNHWAYSYVQALAANHITYGVTETTFQPNTEINRVQFTAFLARTLNDDFKTGTGELKVHFIDVGQGDSSLIELPNGKTILIDGGKRTAGEIVVSYLKQAGVSSIDLLVATHPDADHIGGLIDVLQQVTVKKVLDSGKEHTTETYLEYLSLIDEKNIPFEVAKKGSSISLDPSVAIKVVHADSSAADNNDASVVLELRYKDASFLFTGDAGTEVEESMIVSGLGQVDVLKVSHHGSDTGTSQSFVNVLKPEIAVISVGENSYGHPHDVVVNRLAQAGAQIYSTMQSGDIIITTNGTTYEVSDDPWQVPKTPIEQGVVITNVNLDTEVVTIKNNGTSAVELTGWKLVSVVGKQTYTFPSDYSLAAGATVYITSGPSAKDQPPTYLKWTGSYIWNNDGDEAELYNTEGVKVSEYK